MSLDNIKFKVFQYFGTSLYFRLRKPELFMGWENGE